MEISINTTRKEFTIDQAVTVKELMKLVEQYGLQEFKLVPKIEYRETITWPTIYPQPAQPWQPHNPIVTYNTNEEASWQVN